MRALLVEIAGKVPMEELLNSIDTLSAFSVGMELFAALVAGLLLIACFLEKGYRLRETRYFMGILAVHVVLLVCDAALWVVSGTPESASKVGALLLVIDLLAYVALALFTCFITEYVGQFAPVSPFIKRVACAVCAVAAVLWAFAMVVGDFAYSINIDGEFAKGVFYGAGAAFGIGVLVLNLLFVAWHRKALELHTTVVLLLYGILPLAGFALQPVWDTTPVYLGSTLASVLCYAVIHVEQTKRFAQQERDLAESRVAIAVSQIQPHFLFNALNSICYLCGSEPKEAQKALREFSDYLRMNIDSIGVNKPTFFLVELDHVKTYLKLEKMRFEDDLLVEYDIQATDFKVPPLSVQPLVENAVKHGVCKKPGGGTVTLLTRELANRFEVVVRDDGVGFDPAVAPSDGREHVGIRNVRQRLWAMCGASLAVESSPGQGTTVTISIPKEGNRA